MAWCLRPTGRNLLHVLKYDWGEAFINPLSNCLALLSHRFIATVGEGGGGGGVVGCWGRGGREKLGKREGAKKTLSQFISFVLFFHYSLFLLLYLFINIFPFLFVLNTNLGNCSKGIFISKFKNYSLILIFCNF